MARIIRYGLAAAMFLLAGTTVRADLPKRPPMTVIGLQTTRTTRTIPITAPGGSPATATLVDLNPAIGRWYVLRIDRPGTAAPAVYHLENPYPERRSLALDEAAPDGLVLMEDGRDTPCPLWAGTGSGELEKARGSGQVFAPLCGGKCYLRNPVSGHRTAIENVTDFLRDKLPGGDTIVGFVRDTFFKDAYREEAQVKDGGETTTAAQQPGFPRPAMVNATFTDRLVTPVDLGIAVEAATGGMRMGQWYAGKEMPGIFVSLIQPQAVAAEILAGHHDRVNRLDPVEAEALAYIVAFDLSRFDVGYAIGTEHPRVDWSERILPQMKGADLPGPDGIGTIWPLVADGMVNPDESARTVATFTGGFKRIHGAFRYGELAYRNHGSHYGFVQSGTLLSTLQPGLATLVMMDDGRVEMKTWLEADAAEAERITHARQNGVAIVEWDPVRRQPLPGALVNRWGPGNWSGSSEKNLRSLRAGVAIQQTVDRQFLVYGYFSTATPSAMARVFQAYGVHYAMHLDMNALEHTYLSLYRRDGRRLLVQHFIQGMSVLDKTDKGQYVPRFIGYPDNRDFFYVMRRKPPETP